MNARFWKDKRVLVTGHTGFKGSWLSLWLQKLGAEVIGFSNSIPTKPSLYEEAEIENRIISIKGDVRNYNEFKNTFVNHKPEIVIHMAAQSLVHLSYKDPVETYSSNVMGTVNLLDITKNTKIPKVIIVVTSDKCYRNLETSRAFTENDPMGGYDPYSSSKGCAELVTDSFRNSFFNFNNSDYVALASVRAGNVIGGGDWAPYRLIPDIMRGIIKNEIIKIRQPDAIRHWQYVLDPLHGYLLLAEKLWEKGPEYSEAWNFGPAKEEAKPVSWILEKLKQCWNNGVRWELDKSDFEHEANSLILDSKKAITRLGWKSKVSLEDTIKLVAEWYEQYQNKVDARKICEHQIELFEKMN